VVQYDDGRDLYMLLTAHRLCFERRLLGVAASVEKKIAPVLSNFMEPGDYATRCKVPDYEQ